jgi:hypothetical protein
MYYTFRSTFNPEINNIRNCKSDVEAITKAYDAYWQGRNGDRRIYSEGLSVEWMMTRLMLDDESLTLQVTETPEVLVTLPMYA